MDDQAVKDSLNNRAEDFARWLFPNGKKNGREWLVGSLQGEAGKSLKICIAGSKVGVFKDFATGDKGTNLLDLFIQARRVPFKEAMQACADWLGVSLDARAARPRAAPIPKREAAASRRGCKPSDVYQCTDEDWAAAEKMVETLISDPALCERIALMRGWKRETIAQLAQERYLGWQGDNLCFIYDTGAKLRQWRTKGEKIIWWAFGKPFIWRSEWLKRAQTVYVCEGEPDCISLVDCGIESDGATRAIATPSANTFDESWAPLFKGKHIILAFDNDKAGEAATTRVSRILRTSARSLRKLDWEGLRHASGGC